MSMALASRDMIHAATLLRDTSVTLERPHTRLGVWGMYVS